jgi:hypothetical protein
MLYPNLLCQELLARFEGIYQDSHSWGRDVVSKCDGLNEVAQPAARVCALGRNDPGLEH